MHPDPTVIGFLGMKGLIELRVADMLAKQAALQHKASLFQSHIAQHEADKAVLYKNRADAASTVKLGASSSTKVPHSSTWYEPSGTSIMNMGKKHLAAARYPIDPPVTRMKMARRGFDVFTVSISAPKQRFYSDFL